MQAPVAAQLETGGVQLEAFETEDDVPLPRLLEGKGPGRRLGPGRSRPWPLM